jgi:RNA polymerase sigma factor (sigma-70 family)
MSVATHNDAELVHESLTGNRDAFGQIVARYQSLVCSLAFSATGSLSQSEDLAQETFVTAWQQLRDLREPEKLRSWLCRIARNLTFDALRQQGREPSYRAETLEEVAESLAPEPLPTEQTISNEEQTILWRSLEKIPEIYREPLVLFYREHQSIEAVAQNLELSEDAVKQRPSRGRKLLHEEVLAFVEGALKRTNPGKAFTLVVLAAMPAATFSAKAATLGAVVKSGVGAKTAGAASLLGALLGPLIVFIPNLIAYRVALAGTQSDEERVGIKTFFGKVGLITMAIFLPVAVFVLWITRHEDSRPYMAGLFASVLVFIFVPTIFLLIIASRKGIRSYLSRILDKEYGGVLPKPALEYRSRLSFLGLPLLHIRVGDRFAVFRKPVKAWIAIGNSAVGGLFACGAVAIAPISMGGVSIGLLSFGALSFGVVAVGGIALGVWPMFGALLIGWQPFGGCFALGWNAAVGEFAFARDYALGQFAVAAQANNQTAREFIQPNFFFHCASVLNRHWLGMMFFWAIPFLVLWRIYTRQPKQGMKARAATRLLVPLILASAFLLAGCNKSGELGKASTFTKPAGPVELKQHWRAGERIVKSFDLKMTSEISIPNQPSPINQNMTLGQEWELAVLKENSDGSHEGEMELLKLRMKLEQGGKAILDYDSENKPSHPGNDPTAATLQKALADAMGAKIQFVLNASNRVEKMDGAEALRSRLAANGANGPAAGIKSMFNDGYLRQMIGDSHGLPANPVQSGDTWPAHDDVSLNDLGSIATDYEYTFNNWENHGKRPCARLEFQGTLKGKSDPKPGSGGMNMSLQNGSVSGVAWFDPGLGLVTDANLNQDITMLMTMPVSVQGKSMTITMTNVMHQVIEIKLESVK